MKYLIVAAKTGGHIFPAKAIAEELINNNHEIVLLGVGNEIENKAYKGLNSKVYSISIDGFRGQRILKKFYVLAQTLKSVFKVLKIIKKENIDAMIGFGGFICVPAGIAIWIKRLPIFIHEQNAIMGTANRFLSKIAKINFLGFPIKQIKRSIISGNPIRKSFINNDDDRISYDQNEIRIYITGGSQGANFINQEIPIVLKELTCNLKIKHQSGENNLNEVNSLYDSENIQDLLVKQICSSVRWRESLINMAQDGVKNFVEIGPGKALSGMVKRTLKKVNSFSINSITDIKNLENEFKK